MMLLGSGEPSRELATALRHLGAQVKAVNDDVADVDPLGVSAEWARLEPDFVVTVTDSIPDATLAAVEATIWPGPTTSSPSWCPAPAASGSPPTGRAAPAGRRRAGPAHRTVLVRRVGRRAQGRGRRRRVSVAAETGGGRPRLVAGPGDIELAWHLAVGQEAAPRRVLAETVVDIEFEVSLLAVRTDGPMGPVIEFCAPIGHRGSAGILESWQPQELSPAATDAAKSVAARIVKALGGRGVFSVELLVNGDEVYFAGVTACPHPSAWVTLRSQRLSAFELQARAILGLPVDTMMVSPGPPACRVPVPARRAPTG